LLRQFVRTNRYRKAIKGDGFSFAPSVTSQPFSPAIAGHLNAPVVNLNKGSVADFAAQSIKDKWVLVQTDVLDDKAGVTGIFGEYVNATQVESMVKQHQAKGIIYMGSRPKNLLYRITPSLAAANDIPIILVEREHGLRIQRLLVAGHQLEFSPHADIDERPAYQSFNVVAEIKGDKYPDEYVVIGAHLDSYDLGSGALDNGANAMIMLDIARQIKKLGLKPKRTMRFVMYNGEEQGFYGSWAYTKTHVDELDKTVMTATVDMGTGPITGFYTNGRSDFIPALDKMLAPVSGLGPFTQVNHAVVGTDNYDFMVQGVPNLVAVQQDANYSSNYHAQSDTFDKVDQQQLKLNSAIMAAMSYGFANIEQVSWKRHNNKQIQQLVDNNDLKQSMLMFNLWQPWLDGKRGMNQ
jgi:hypothetical protein